MRNFPEISNQNRETVKYRIKTISDRTPFLWVYLPNEYKLATSLHDLNSKQNTGIVINVFVGNAKILSKI